MSPKAERLQAGAEAGMQEAPNPRGETHWQARMRKWENLRSVAIKLHSYHYRDAVLSGCQAPTQNAGAEPGGYQAPNRKSGTESGGRQESWQPPVRQRSCRKEGDIIYSPDVQLWDVHR